MKIAIGWIWTNYKLSTQIIIYCTNAKINFFKNFKYDWRDRKCKELTKEETNINIFISLLIIVGDMIKVKK